MSSIRIIHDRLVEAAASKPHLVYPYRRTNRYLAPPHLINPTPLQAKPPPLATCARWIEGLHPATNSQGGYKTDCQSNYTVLWFPFVCRKAYIHYLLLLQKEIRPVLLQLVTIIDYFWK